MQTFNLDGTYLKEWKFAGLPCGLYLGADKQMYLAKGSTSPDVSRQIAESGPADTERLTRERE